MNCPKKRQLIAQRRKVQVFFGSVLPLLTYPAVFVKFNLTMNILGRKALSAKKALPVLNVVLGLLLGAAVLLFVRDIVSLSLPVSDKAASPGRKPEVTRMHALQDYAGILRNNPFGFPGGDLSPLSAAREQAVSRTDIKLIGTVAGRKRVSYAIFSDKTGKQDVYRVGDSVFGLGKLIRVEKYRVFVGTGDGIEIPLADVATIKEIQAPGGPGNFATRTGAETYQIDMQSVQQAIAKPTQIMTDARFMPNMVNGRQEGFVLSEVKPGGVYASLGLRNGDVLLRINQFNISSPEAALQALTALRSIDRAELDIVRGGEKMTMTYQLR
jgi:general secretion pathway protein C